MPKQAVKKRKDARRSSLSLGIAKQKERTSVDDGASSSSISEEDSGGSSSSGQHSRGHNRSSPPPLSSEREGIVPPRRVNTIGAGLAYGSDAWRSYQSRLDVRDMRLSSSLGRYSR